ncbi:acyl transferase domain-containing protein/D-arabinose 1-dehydrogenase-like Zn-dependent alcohol dehydrogenase [Haloactinomyces albus]|uniref:Acyl transferase domain-containing protein/D-arabinose 1-dehydrogenase-like Zn-dependent alcohol dehydrogenase n=1 Tax=Haloactinomyces albus TaxID=1352928 RepID=A0AAE4CNP4_9ACTN|nr:acyl transferase domain-containing protein/D-arabinose 1-dehydrogenase-like Zn-dependent alcohol dehydrogenase [Haloactinomyces albus]
MIGSRYGGFIEGIDRFDAGFFSFSRREARTMDPQQRLLLEVAWEAFEDAGLRAGADAGVYLGIIANEYAERLPLDTVDLASLTGAGSRNAAAGRLSRFLGTTGPSMVLDTDRSSSLVAVEQASQALARGECSVALAGGSNLILSPRTSMAFSSAGGLAPDGRCKFGDANADGFVRSEAVGLVVLKPFEAALADGDSIYAVILGSAVNSNGEDTPDLMRPSVDAQVDVLRSACRAADVAPEEVDYVEAHGTGTPVGDPVELTALATAYRGQSGDLIRVGSVKTNIGHTEAAAGVCGLIKTAWALREGVLPPSLHFETPRRDIDFDGLGLRIVTERESWSEAGNHSDGVTRRHRGGDRLAGVSSFGLTGTNAHVVLASVAEAKRRFPVLLPPAPEPEPEGTTPEAQVIAISAHSRPALAAHVRAYRDRVAGWDETAHGSLADLAYTTGARRMHREHRLAAVVRSMGELGRELDAVAEGEPTGTVSTGVAGSGRRVVFVCSGQGSQWLGMGRELLAREPVFADAIRRIDVAARPYRWSPLEELSSGSDSIDVGAYDVQPALFAMTVGLAALWRSWGVEPDAIVGNSMGEVAAAHLAGALTLDDAVRVIWERSRLTASISGTAGEVMAVDLPAEALTSWIEPYEQRVVVGVFSSPYAAVLSGDSAALAELAERFEAEDITCRPVPFRAPIASHSPLMEPLREPMLDALRSVHMRECATPFLSTVDVDYVAEPFGAEYWWRNLREPVRFEPAIRRLLAEGHDTFVELSPHPALRSPVEDTACEAGATAKVVSSLRRERPERETLLTNLAELHVWGVPVDWGQLHENPRPTVALPSYPWQRQSYWLNPTAEEPGSGAGTLDASEGESPDDTVAAPATEESDDRAPSFRARLEAVEPREQASLLESFVRREVARVLGEEKPEDIPLDAPFRELGVTSVLGIDLCTRLERNLDHRVPAPVLYRTGTVEALTSRLVSELDLDAAPRSSRSGTSTVDPNAAAGEHSTSGAASSSTAQEPIAVVSSACRFPGDVVDPDGFWELLCNGEDAITDIPASRFDVDAVFDPDPEAEGSTYSRSGGFLGGLDAFDPGFFGIPPHEAKSVDPQQRLLLETTWEALERAGVRADRLKGSKTGVFVGLWANEYQSEALRDTHRIDAYTLLGTNPAAIAGRISYWLGLRGPNFPVNTACSSSLVAVHLACQSLRAGECEQALVGGVNVLLSAAGFVYFSRVRALSPTGSCHAFSADADGYVRAEGCGMVLLKRLSDAERDGDRVLAVVRGSAVNQDGRSNGFTAPNGAAQEEMLQQALAQADIAGETVDAVECHGTGTPLGDPTEVQALAEVYGRDRPANRPLLLGSVKSNIGHTEAAAGIAGLLKAVLALQRETVPPSLHIDRLNPHVPWDELPVRVVTEPTRWPRGTRPRRVGVSSFGISGTNAHVILEEAPGTAVEEAVTADEPNPALVSVPLMVSGHTEPALRGNAARLAARLTEASDEPWEAVGLRDVAAGLATRRTAFSERLVLSVSDGQEAAERLLAFAEGTLPSGAVRASATCSRAVFVFPGQGSQYPGMCRSLLGEPTFRAALAECDEALWPHVGFSVLALLEEDETTQREALARVTVVQPVLFAVSVALARLWAEWGVLPSAVIGHSQGEVAAAVVAGALSVRDGARVVGVRSRLVAGLGGDGGMGSVGLPVTEVERRLAGRTGDLSVAVVNTPESTVVAGDLGELEDFLAALEAEGVHCRRIKVDYASHSAQVAPILDALRSELSDLEPGTGDVALYSTVRGERLDGSELDGAYWADNLREPVRLDRALEALAPGEETAFLELGAHPLLVGPLGGAGHVAVGSLHQDHQASARVRSAAAELFAHGVPVDWEAVWHGADAQAVDLPTYAFQRDSYWLRLPKTGPVDAARLGLDSGEHPLLPARTDLSDGSVLFTGSLDRTAQQWLDDHRVFETVLVPGTALVEMALHAARAVGLAGVGEVLLEGPLALAAEELRRVQLVAAPPDDEGNRTFTIHSRVEGGAADAAWVQHVTGTLAARDVPAPTPVAAWPPAEATPVDLTGLYERLAARGYGYGPAFRGLAAAWRHGTTTFAEVTLPSKIPEDEGFGVHPALLDAMLHGVLETAADDEGVILPFEWRGVALHAIGATALRARIERTGREFRIDAFDLAGQPLATIEAFAARSTTEAQLNAALTEVPQQLYRLHAIPLRDTEAMGTSKPCFVEGLTTDVESAFAELENTLVATDDAGEDGAEAPPPTIVVDWSGSGPSAEGVHEATQRGLAWLQHWLRADRASAARVVWMTRGALACRVTDTDVNPAAAALWGLGRTAQLEHPDRDLVLLDVDDTVDPPLADVLARIPAGEPQLVARQGELSHLRLESAERSDGLEPPAADAWRLDIGEQGDLSTLRLAPHPEAADTLASGCVRIAVRASGINFRDVLTAMDMYPGAPEPLGFEGAGVVVEVADDVTDLVPGDRVVGLFASAFASLAIVDARKVRPIPAAVSFTEAATVPVVFLTALYALDHLAQLASGERLLLHSAAGGVGHATIQLARLRGVEVFATASPAKWDDLRALGLPDDHIASSRDTDFEAAFARVTGGAGVDVVLNSLTDEKIDASLRLLSPGGRFIEMGKTDIRDTETLRERYPGVFYRAFDLIDEVAPEGIGAMLDSVLAGMEQGSLRPLPYHAVDLRNARDAFRAMAQGRHTGKLVFQPPLRPLHRELAPEGTVLITGGTGGLAGALAEHLVTVHGVRHLLLLSRSGNAAPGADDRVAKLLAAGAETVRVEACDVSDRKALADVLETVPSAHPLTAVVHAAGILDDGLLADLSPERVDTVLGPKIDAAWHLHELTREQDLSAFVLFSSVVGTFGNASQGPYAAANAALDALATRRRATGLAATSIAWGTWADVGMVTRLEAALQQRLRRGGLVPLRAEQGLRLFDEVLAGGRTSAIAVQVDQRALQRAAEDDVLAVPSVLRGFVRAPVRRAADAATAATGGLAERLAALDAPEARHEALLEVVRAEIAAVMGMAGAESIPVGGGQGAPALRELGVDSLMAVEIRNRLSKLIGEALPATLLFDHPTADALTRFLAEKLGEPVRRAPIVASKATERDERHDEPIAIVSMACRFPGEVRTPEQLWGLLADGGEGITPFPERPGWDVDTLYSPDPDEPGRSMTREGGFLHDAGWFDASFFGISPREAERIDPQQRLLLEVSWEALERMGVIPASLEGSSTGVYFGLMYNDYGGRLLGRRESLDGYVTVGSLQSAASGRLAYTLGLQGPAVSVDTACSSSLVSIHQAMQGLRRGECDLAFAGGVTVMATPSMFIEFSRQRGIAPDGRCKPFSDAADGAGWSEGCGVLLLERLSDARANSREVLAVLRSSAVNQDGRSQGLTAPNGPSQERVIQQALAAGGIGTSDVDAVEAHGTGTSLGDPIEANALLSTYGKAHSEQAPLYVGSIKSNIGHPQAAAGVAGVIKMVQALQHEELPRSLYADAPTSHVDWASGNVRLLDETVPWPHRHEHVRRAGVSSFGISGTNAHVILEEVPANAVGEAVTEDKADSAPVSVPLVISGHTESALRANAARLATFVESVCGGSRPGDVLPDVAYGLVTRRTAFAERVALSVSDCGETVERLRALAGGSLPAGAVRGAANCSRAVFVFPGQGSQYPGMCRSLLGDTTFRAALAECDEALWPHVDFSVVEFLSGDEESQREALRRVTVVQPVLFAVAVALARVWARWGVVPSAVVGHSQGEVAAAVVAGVLTVEEGARVVGVRSRLIAGLDGHGGMGSVGLPVADVERRLAERGGELSVAVVNTGESTVVAGASEELEEFLSELEAEGMHCRRIAVDYASHSAQVDPILGEIRSELSDLAPGTGRVPMYSTVRGEAVDGRVVDADYWVDNLRRPVRLDRALEALGSGEETAFVELSAHPLLVGPLGGAGHVVVGSLHQEQDANARIRSAAAELFAHGVPVDWETVWAGSSAHAVDLPTYAFQRQHYWLDAAPPTGDGASDGTRVVDDALWDAIRAHEVETVAGMLEIPDQRHADLAALLPPLARWRARRAADAELANWLYDEQWIPAPSHDGVPRLAGTWVLLTEATRTQQSEPIVTAVEEAGAIVLRLELPSDPDEAAAQLASATADTSLSGILMVFSEEPGAGPEPGFEPVHCSAVPELARRLMRILAVVRSLDRVASDAPLWLLTSGAIATASEDVLHAPSQSALWGLGRVIGLEHPGRLGGLVDLPYGTPGRAITDALIATMANEDDEDQVALRLRQSGSVVRLVRRVVRARSETGGVDEDIALAGTVLITGGTGGLGARTARWLAAECRGRLHLVLISRRGEQTPGAVGLREELEGLGAAVTIACCDVTKRDELERLLKGLDEPVRGVFHAAGTTELRPLASHDAPYVERELSAKVAGAQHLDALLGSDTLESFVLYGSLAGFWGSGDQGAYAAANAFLDGLARRRRARGVPATVLHWGSWGEGGMVTAETDAQLRRRGLKPMAPEVAIRGLELALRDDRPALAVADIEWPSFASSYAAGHPRPLLLGVDDAKRVLEGNNTREDVNGAAPQLGERLEGLPVDKREEAVLEAVRAEIATVFGMPDAASVPPERPLRELGLDSMMAVQARDRLTVLCGRKLSPSLLFDHPTAEELAAYLTSLMCDDLGDLAQVESVLERLEHVSEEALQETRLGHRIVALAQRIAPHEASTPPRSSSESRMRVEDVSDDELLTFIDQEIEDM